MTPSEEIDSRYLLAILLSEKFSRFAESVSGRSGIPKINRHELEEFTVALPPIDEQQRIAEILDSADEQIRHGDSIVLKQKILEDGIVEDLLKDRSGAESSLDELSSPERGSMTIGPFGSNLVAADYQDSGVPVVFVQDIQSGSYRNVSGVHISAAKARNLAAHSVRSGDLLLTKMGLPPCVAAIYPTGSSDAVITADIIRIRPDTEKINPYWLACAINQERFRHKVREITAGVTRPKVTLRDVRNLRIVVPSLHEQHESVAIIEGARNQRIGAEAALAKMRQFKQGLLDDLLTGRMRVTALSLGMECAVKNDAVERGEPAGGQGGGRLWT